MSRLIDADALEPDADYDDGDYWAVSIAQIQNAPTIEPQHKTGKWTNRWAQNGDQVREVRECSECGAVYLRFYDTADGFDCVPPKYCPNCGAKMEVENG